MSSKPRASLLPRDARSLLRLWTVTPLEAAGASRPPEPTDPGVRCIVVLGAALISYGLPAHRVEESILRLGRAFGREVSVFGLPTAAIITLHDEVGSRSYTARAEPGAIDLSRLDALHDLVAQVERNQLDAISAEREVARILHSPRRYPRWLDLPAVALVALGGARMLSVDLMDAAWAALLGLLLAALLHMSNQRPGLGRIAPVLGSVGVTTGRAWISP